jgi:hypothetical protein
VIGDKMLNLLGEIAHVNHPASPSG